MLAINQFIDKIKLFESKHSKNFTMSMTEAKALHTDITKLLLVINDTSSKPKQNDEITEVKITGLDW